MKEVLLSTVLTPSQIRKVKQICTIWDDGALRLLRLKAYLKGYRASLMKKGFDSDYLACGIEANVQRELEKGKT